MVFRPVIDSLLQALEAGGGVDAARTERAALDARGWGDLTRADIDRLLVLIEQGVDTLADGGPAGQPDSVEEPLLVIDPGDGRPRPCSIQAMATTDLPDGPWSPEDDYGAFLGALGDGPALLRAAQRLATADTFDDAVAAARKVFADLLGFEPADLDERRRIGGKTIREHRVAARYGRFAVSVVGYAYPWSWPTVAAPVFRLHPEGIVIGIAPGWSSVRFFVRLVRGAGAGLIRCRTMTGWRTGRDALDNLAVWVGRLAGLRPRFGDDEAALVGRAQKQLLCDPADLGHGWTSLPLDEAARVPGVSWAEIGRRGEHGFLQAGSSPRWFWGLQRVLTDRFPISIGPRGIGCLIRFVSYEVASSDSPRLEDALATATTWRRPLLLHLDVEFPGGGRVPLEIEAGVPRCTSDGRFLFEGRWYRFGPSVGPHGRLVTGRLDHIDDLDEDYLELYDLDELPMASPTTSGIDPSSSADGGDDSEIEDEENPPKVDEDAEQEADWDGGSIGSLLEVAVTRKLSAIVRRTMKLPADAAPIDAFLNIVRSLSGDEGLLLLTSKRFLLAALRPVADSTEPGRILTTVRSHPTVEPGFVPSWACLDASSGLPAHEWLPIAGARLAPWAGLAVPVPGDGGTLALGFDPDPATSMNPRAGAPERGPREWWIAEGLADFRALPAGQVPSGAAILAEGTRLRRFFGARVPGPRLRVLVDRRHLAGLERRVVHVSQRIPFLWSPGKDQDPVEITVAAGAIVGPGTPWLRAPKRLWNRADCRTPSARPERWLKATIEEKSGGRSTFDDESYATWSWTLPHGLTGTVTDARLEPVRLPGGVQVAWMASIELRARPVGVNAVLADGRAAPVEELRPADAPYASGDGDPATVVIEDPLAATDWNAQIWFDGRSGEFVEDAALETGPIMLLPLDASQRLEGPDWEAPRRLLDGAGIPRHSRAPAIPTWQSNLWAGAEPAPFAAVADEQSRWHGGAPPWLAHAETLAAALDCSERTGGVDRARRGWKQEPWARRVSDTPQKSVRYPAPWRPPQEYRCRCGKLVAPDRFLASCALCGTPVIRRPARSAPQHPFIHLPVPVPHPWRLAPLAALLGLTEAEAASEFAAGGADAMFAAAESCVDDPWARLEQRLTAVGGREERLRFARGIATLQAELGRKAGGRPDIDRFFVRKVPVLPPALATAGMPARSPALAMSLLAHRYRRLSAAAERYRKVASEGVELLLELARYQLLDRLRQLFGPPDADPGTASLAALARRLFPPSRPPGLRDVPYGLLRVRTRRGISQKVRYISPPPAIGGSNERGLDRRTVALDRGSDSEGLGVVLADGAAWIPTPAARGGSPADHHFWAERDARPAFFGRHLPFIATVVGGLDSPELRGGTTLHAPQALTELRRGRGAGWSPLASISSLFRASCRAESRFGAFVATLEAPRPRSLAADGVEATRAVRALIDPAFPGGDPELERARSLLAEILVGWWSVPPDRGAPYGWAWLGPAASERPRAARHRIPPLISPAWRSWPGVDALFSPAVSLSDGLDASPLSWHPWLRLASGLPVEVPRSLAGTISPRLPEPTPQGSGFVPTFGAVWGPNGVAHAGVHSGDAAEPRPELPVAAPAGLEPIGMGSEAEAPAAKDEVRVGEGRAEGDFGDARVLRSSVRAWLVALSQGGGRAE